MRPGVEISGLSQVIANLRIRMGEVVIGTNRGLLSAGQYLQRESQRLVPVETGDLKASAFTRITGVGFGRVVQVGYTAPYAMFVHEAVGMVLRGIPRPSGKGRYWDPIPRAQAKFLEEPARRLASVMKRIVYEEARF